MQEVIDIHGSHLFGIVVETGAGAAITSKLTAVPGAGSTLYFSKVPYSKAYEKLQYGEFERSVSDDFTEQALMEEYRRLSEKERETVNFILVASSQIQTKPGVISHVWFSLSDMKYRRTITAHYTFPKSGVVPPRPEINEKIGSIGTQLLRTIVEEDGLEDRIAGIGTEATLDACYVNGELSASPVNILEKSSSDYFLAFGKGQDSKMEFVRFEELLRKGDQFIMNKGSFNPVHFQHLEMVTHAQQLVPGAVPVFMISTYRYDKPHISWEELKPRIEAITSLGCYVVVCKEALFYNTFKMLRMTAGKTKKFYFTIGSDTLNRIFRTDLDGTVDADHPDPSPYMARIKIEGMKRIWSDQFKFILFQRLNQGLEPGTEWYDSFLMSANDYQDDGTSSTKIRNGEIKNKI